MMTEMHERDEFAPRLKRCFDDSVRSLDAGTGARIARCREQALAQAGNSWSPSSWLPAGAAATACLALLIYSLLPGQESASPPAPPAAAESPAVLEQMEMISDLDLYEDLEFYQWLEQYELPS